jgi:hypothetical protein
MQNKLTILILVGVLVAVQSSGMLYDRRLKTDTLTNSTPTAATPTTPLSPAPLPSSAATQITATCSSNFTALDTVGFNCLLIYYYDIRTVAATNITNAFNACCCLCNVDAKCLVAEVLLISGNGWHCQMDDQLFSRSRFICGLPFVSQSLAFVKN